MSFVWCRKLLSQVPHVCPMWPYMYLTVLQCNNCLHSAWNVVWMLSSVVEKLASARVQMVTALRVWTNEIKFRGPQWLTLLCENTQSKKLLIMERNTLSSMWNLSANYCVLSIFSCLWPVFCLLTTQLEQDLVMLRMTMLSPPTSTR